MSYIPPEFEQDPIEITQRGSIICSYSRRMTGAIFMKIVPAVTIRSASRGVLRITSAPKRAISYLLVRLVAISTKQQERPKPKGQMEFFCPHATSCCSRPKKRFFFAASSSAGVFPQLSRTRRDAVSTLSIVQCMVLPARPRLRLRPFHIPVQGAQPPEVGKRGYKNGDEDEDFPVPGPAKLSTRDSPGKDKNRLKIKDNKKHRNEIEF